jgi:hypothetical protein
MQALQGTTRLSSRDLAAEVAESADEDELLEARLLMATKEIKKNERKLAIAHDQQKWHCGHRHWIGHHPQVVHRPTLA